MIPQTSPKSFLPLSLRIITVSPEKTKDNRKGNPHLWHTPFFLSTVVKNWNCLLFPKVIGLMSENIDTDEPYTSIPSWSQMLSNTLDFICQLENWTMMALGLLEVIFLFPTLNGKVICIAISLSAPAHAVNTSKNCVKLEPSTFSLTPFNRQLFFLKLLSRLSTKYCRSSKSSSNWSK